MQKFCLQEAVLVAVLKGRGNNSFKSFLLVILHLTPQDWVFPVLLADILGLFMKEWVAWIKSMLSLHRLPCTTSRCGFPQH